MQKVKTHSKDNDLRNFYVKTNLEIAEARISQFTSLNLSIRNWHHAHRLSGLPEGHRACLSPLLHKSRNLCSSTPQR